MKNSLFAFGWMFFSLFAGTSQAAPEIKQSVVDLLKPKLNSDRSEYFFGNFGVDVLDIDSPVFPFSRISNLHSVHQGRKIMRTLAVVDFFHPVHADLNDVHRKIMEGKSIGIALREQGWIIQKKPVYFGITLISPRIMDWMDESSLDQAVLQVYRLEVSKNDVSVFMPYCTIIELHSPQYLTEEWKRALYEDQYEEFSVKSDEAADLLFRLSMLMQDFPFSWDEIKPKR